MPLKHVPIKYPESPVEDVVLSHSGWTISVSDFMLTTSDTNNKTRKLAFYIKLTRNWNGSGIFLHFYLPSFILCFASTLSLFIHQDLLPARMCLSVTSCLTLITLVMGAKYVTNQFNIFTDNFIQSDS